MMAKQGYRPKVGSWRRQATAVRPLGLALLSQDRVQPRPQRCLPASSDSSLLFSCVSREP